MKYKLYISEIYYGVVTIEAASAQEASIKAYDADINYFESEITDVVAEVIDEEKENAQ